MERIVLASCFMPLDPPMANFWETVQGILEKEKMQLMLLTTDLPERTSVPAIQIPFLFADYAREFGALPADPMERMGELEIALVDRDRNFRKPGDKHFTETLLGMVRCQKVLEIILSELNPALVLPWGSTLPQSLLLYQQARERGIAVQVIERGLLPQSYMLEPRGHGGWSRLLATDTGRRFHHQWKKEFLLLKDELLKSARTKYASPSSQASEQILANARSKFKTIVGLFGDFDTASGIYPRYFSQSTDSSLVFSSTRDACQALKTWARQHPECAVIFKPHPQDQTDYEALASENLLILRQIHPHHLLKQADLLVFLTSTLQFEALFYEKPIVLLARSQLWGKGVAYQVADDAMLAGQIENALRRQNWKKHLQAAYQFIHFVANDFLYFDPPLAEGLKTAHHLAEHLLRLSGWPVDTRAAAERIAGLKKRLAEVRQSPSGGEDRDRVEHFHRSWLQAVQDLRRKLEQRGYREGVQALEAMAQAARKEFAASGRGMFFSPDVNNQGFPRASRQQPFAPPVCVAGMHRSGTSVLTHMLHTAGLYLGQPEDILSPSPENPEGFWENKKFLQINDSLLSICGGNWANPPAIDLQQLASLPEWEVFLGKVKEFLSQFRGQHRWGWKDPRNSITLPFWKSLFPNLQVVASFRNPLAVARSLQKRNGFPLEHGLDLWFRYNRALLTHGGEQVIWVPYELLLEQPEQTFQQLADALGWFIAAPLREAVARLVKPSLNHFDEARQGGSEGRIPEQIEALYRQLLARTQIQPAPGIRSGRLQKPAVSRFITAQNPPSFREQISQIERLVEEGALKLARQKLDLLASQLGEDDPLWNQIGVLYFHLSRYREALRAFQKAYQANPRDLSAAKNLADLSFQLGEPEVTAQIYHQIFQRQPDDPDALILAGKLAYQMGRVSDAERLFKQVLQNNPEHPQAKANLAYLKANPGPAEPVFTVTRSVKAFVDEVVQKTNPAPASALPEPAKQSLIRCPNCQSLAYQRARYTADIVTCVDCGITYLRRLPDKRQMKLVYELYADEIFHMRLPTSQEEIEQSILRREDFLEEIASHVQKPGKMLDVGCGWGAFLDAARRRGFQPQGIEMIPRAAQFARQQLGIAVDTRPLEQQSFPANTFTLVTMNHVLEHLPDIREIVNTVHNLLAPDGLFAGMVPNFASFCSEMEREHWAWLNPNFHYVHFTPQTLRQVLESAGFMVERVYTVRGDYNPWRLASCVIQKFGPLSPEEIDRKIRELEASGRGEEIRFIARKPARVIGAKREPSPKNAAHPSAQMPALSQHRKQNRQAKVRPKRGTRPQFSIIIPVYNQVAYTEKCLENIYRNTSPEVHFEVIVVDNASTDRTPEFLEQARQRYTNLHFIRSEKNLKYAGGCNLGAKQARGQYLVFLNNDTEPQPGWLTNAWRVFQEEQNVGVLGAKLLYPDRTVQHCGIAFKNSKNENYFIWPEHPYRFAREDNPLVNYRREWPAVTGACLFISRKLFQQVQGFDETYGMYFEDTDLCFKVRAKGKRVLYEPSIVLIHHEGKSTEQRSQIDEFNRRAAAIFYQKWEEELVSLALEVLTEQVDGKYHYFSEFFYPHLVTEANLIFFFKMLARLGNFYAAIGGIGDLLLSLASFYDRVREATVVCAPNHSGAARILFSNFDKIRKVYFLPFPVNRMWHFVLRNLCYKLPNCLGAGVSPREEYAREWKAGLDLFRKYGVQEKPRWVSLFKTTKRRSFQVVLQPKGSVRGMVGSKRNIIRPREWIRLQQVLIENGIEPIILGTPEEQDFYPALVGALDCRSYNLTEQMQLVCSADVFIGADSWGKTLAALAGIPTFVFMPCRGKDLQNWEDPSEHVFLRPWKTITLVEDLDHLLQVFPRITGKSLRTARTKREIPIQPGQQVSPYFDLLLKPNQVFLYREAGMGDVLMAFPLARALKKAYPDLGVNFSTNLHYKHLVDSCPDIDRFIPLDVLRTYLIFEPNVTDLNPARYGYAPQHQVLAYLNQFDLHPCPEECNIRLTVPKWARQRLSSLLEEMGLYSSEDNRRKGQKVILLHPAKGDPNRTWPEEKWAQLARLLLANGHRVLVVGSTSTSQNRGIHRLQVAGLVHLEDRLSPLEFVALCEQADILISTDSGPVQLAAATDIAIVGIYSVVRGAHRLPFRHGQAGWNAVAIEPACPFAPCYEKMNDPDFMKPYLEKVKAGELTPAELFAGWCLHSDRFACMQHMITVQQVWEALQPFLLQGVDTEAILQRVDQLIRESHFVEAQRELEQWIENPQVDARLIRRYVELLKERGEWVRYVEWLEKYVQRNPNDAAAVNELGVVRWQQNRREEAIRLFTSAVSLNGNAPDHIKNLADALLAEEQFEPAIRLYLYLIQKYPQDPEAYQRLASLYIEDGKYEQAARLLDRALSYHPDDAFLQTWRRLVNIPQLYLAYQFLNQGELDTARQLFEEVLSEHPRNEDALSGLGSIFFHRKQFAPARKVYRQILKQQPGHPEALFFLGKIFLLEGKQAEWERLVQQNQEAFRQQPALRKLAIEWLLEQEKFDQALKALDQYVEEFPEDAEGYLILGNLFYEGGRVQEARRFYTRALQLEPENEALRSLLANLSGEKE